MTELIDLTAEVKRDRYGRYLITPVDGGKPVAHTRATTVAEVLDDRYNLELWKMRQVAIGLTRRSDLLAKVAADETDKKALNAACSEAMDAAESGAAANTGTALHTVLERFHRGDITPGTAPEMFADIVERYALALDTNGVTICTDAIETVHVLSGLAEPIAGMADMHVTIGGHRYVADIKTGSGIDFGARGFAVQLAIYAHAQTLYDYADDTHRKAPIVEQDRGLIIHVPAKGGDITLHWLDIASGWKAVEQSLWARAWRKRKDLLSDFTPEVAAPKRSTPQRITPVATPANDGPTQAPEGDLADPAKVAALVARATESPAVGRVVNRWVSEGKDAGVAWNFGGDTAKTERRYALALTALELAENLAASDDPDEADAVARAALRIVIGDDADRLMLSVGGLIGTLSMDEARNLYRIATTSSLAFDGDGAPRLTVAA